MYGLIALDRKMQSVRGLLFFEHQEITAFRDSVAYPIGVSRWIGRRIINSAGEIQPLEDFKKETFSPADSFDAQSGATMTSDRMEQMILFWLGEWGYQRYLEQLRKESTKDD